MCFVISCIMQLMMYVCASMLACFVVFNLLLVFAQHIAQVGCPHKLFAACFNSLQFVLLVDLGAASAGEEEGEAPADGMQAADCSAAGAGSTPLPEEEAGVGAAVRGAEPNAQPEAAADVDGRLPSAFRAMPGVR
jgi:hypothetical protein